MSWTCFRRLQYNLDQSEVFHTRQDDVLGWTVSRQMGVISVDKRESGNTLRFAPYLQGPNGLQLNNVYIFSQSISATPSIRVEITDDQGLFICNNYTVQRKRNNLVNICYVLFKYIPATIF